jgi:asparagine synthase (glutamine-hydrolysing)
LESEGKSLLAFSSIPQYNLEGVVPPHRFGDETLFIEATSRHVGNIENIYIRAEGISPLDGIWQGLGLHDEPVHTAGNYYWIMALLQEARGRGIGTLLTGQGGNSTISWSGQGYLPSLARTGQWSALRRELLNLRTTQQKPWWRILAGQVVKPLLEPYWSYRHSLLRLGKEPWDDYSAINPWFARRLSLTEMMYARGHDPTFALKTDSRTMQIYLNKPERSTGGALWQELGAGFGLEVRDPTLDKRVVEFCLGIPEDQYAKGGIDRRLIRLGLKGILPPLVLTNPRYGFQAADIGWRVRESLQEISQALDQVENSASARQYLDVTKMRAIVASLKTGVTQRNTYQTHTILLRGLMAGLFVANFLQNSLTKRQ